MANGLTMYKGTLSSLCTEGFQTEPYILPTCVDIDQNALWRIRVLVCHLTSLFYSNRYIK